MPKVTHSDVRKYFPTLTRKFSFFENAGGSQVPQQVIDGINDLLLNGFVQTGAGYPAADYVDDIVLKSKAFANTLVNGDAVGKTLIGPSTTALLYRLSDSFTHTIKAGDELIVSVANHEANIGPWLKLEDRGAKIVWWGVDPLTGEISLEELQRLLTSKTRLVACAHTSNLLGDILDVKEVARLAHNVGALIVVDGVAFAPHQAIDVEKWDADFYVFSFYKVYGPHLAALYGKTGAWAQLKGHNHYFIPDDAFPWKFELGCQPYELLGGVLGIKNYLSEIAGVEKPERYIIESAFTSIRHLEKTAQRKIQDFLVSRSDVRLVGCTSGDNRHPTFSFVHDRLASDEIASRVNAQEVGIRNGHMYAKRLCEALDIHPEPGVVRISAVHTNDEQDVNALLIALERALAI